MKKRWGLGVLLLITAHGWAQTLFGVRGSGFGNATPSQFDWVNWPDAFGPGRGAGERPTGERISVARLRHTPPRKARAAFRRGMRLLAGDHEKALREFASAVAIDPDFSEAHGNLGVEFAAVGLFDKAAAELRRAIELDPVTSIHHSNLAYVLIRLDLKKEAEPEAQTAVALDPSNMVAQCLLGFLLAERPETRQLAVKHLEFAARRFPPAHILLARIYRAQGAESEANLEWERYSQAGKPSRFGAGADQ
jgi:tetratricopeptide (TPR) repeat protein